MSTIARRFIASPVRLSSLTWDAISGLVCQSDFTARAEFQKVAGLASCILNDEVFAEYPLVIKNKGPRLRVYCLYGEDATSGEDKNEDALTWKPTEKEWHGFIPCAAAEVKEMAKTLKTKSSKFSVYNVQEGIPDDEELPESQEKKSTTSASVDWEAFKNL